MKNKLLGFFLLIIVILCALLWRSCNDAQRANATANAYFAANDTLNKKLNDKGQEVTQTRLMLTDYNSIKNELHVSDSTVRKLQAIIDNHTLTATVFNTSSHNKGGSNTIVGNGSIITKHDTLFIYPSYSTIWEGKWSKGSIIATKDSIHRDITMFNEYQIKQSYQPNGDGIKKYIRQRIPVVSITNINPFTTTTALKSYVLSPDKRSRRRAFVLGILGGIAVVMGANSLSK